MNQVLSINTLRHTDEIAAEANRVCGDWRTAVSEGTAELTSTVAFIGSSMDVDLVSLNPASIARSMERGYTPAGINSVTADTPCLQLVMVKEQQSACDFEQ